MKSANGIYEIRINEFGLVKMTKLIRTTESEFYDQFEDSFNKRKIKYIKRAAIFEKNIESLLVSPNGVYLIYIDNPLVTRKPIIFYKHSIQNNNNNSSLSLIHI